MHLVTRLRETMCIEPTMLDGFEVSCRKCWQCRKRRVDDLIGRCIAESKFAKKTYACTLTYGGDAGVNAATLVYKDVQDFLKRLRRKRYDKERKQWKKYDVRYIVAGEYGSKKNRAHWHIILFFDKEYPEVEENKRVNWEYWEHGFTYFQEPDWKGFQYVLKYVLKDQDEQFKVSHLAMSKKPPLGDKYFKELVKQHVEEMVLPRNIFYKFRDVKNSRNKIKKFCMRGKTKDLFLRRIRWRWYKKYGKEPMNELFEEYFMNETKTQDFDVEYEKKRLHDKPVKYAEYWPEVKVDNDHWTKADVTEIEYQGISGILWEHNGKAEVFTETGIWQEIKIEEAQQIKKLGKVIQKQKYDQFLRDSMESIIQET